MHSFYVIYSKSKDHYYAGETNDISGRLSKHNSHVYRGSYTKIASDWKLVLDYKCASKQDALFLEGFVKRMKSRKFIINIIQDPEILKDILNKR